jgi:hypothetical protein
MAKPQDEDRIVRDNSADRASRSTQVEEERQPRTLMDMSDEERSRFLRDEFTNSALPSLPPIPGFHMCWLSTTNQYDSIMRRVRLGYRPVKVDEMPQFVSLSMKTGEYAGCIAVNEMILFKIEEEVYQLLMKTYHHDMPEQEADKLRDMVRQLQSGELSKNKPMIAEVGDGTEELLRRERKKPVFAS